MTAFAAPPFDPELAAALEALSETLPSSITPDMIPALRRMSPDPVLDDMVSAGELVHDEHTIPGHGGAQIIVSIYRRPAHAVAGPSIYYIHGGGMVTGNRFMGVQRLLPFVSSHGAVLASVEYRLAPEHPDPVPVEDCYAGLVWFTQNAAELGADPARTVIAGASAGGGLAAGATLLARDRHGPALTASLLMYPMLDDRNDTVSSWQMQGIGAWDRTSNLTGWSALLGDRRGTDDVSIYAAPARADDLSGLPPTYIDVASAEVFRDEDVAYASRIWASGGIAELHVWPGGFHGFDSVAPHARLSRAMTETRNRWLARMLET
ncbi:MAG: alpha/beta hydrolase fold domain-containing protein [Microcella pacifica]|uniref:alpha/beta hydrolase n=1 Tax=Microcella pacifica TaxID=2591847 RepID=UPI003315F4FE